MSLRQVWNQLTVQWQVAQAAPARGGGSGDLPGEPFARFRTVAEVQMAAARGFRLDVNRATVDDWLRLQGFSIHQARAVVDLTRAGVHLHCLEDLAAVLGTSLQQLQPLQAVLLFCYYDPESLAQWEPVSVNRATVDDLLRLPPVDLYLAQRLLQERCRGPFRNLADLQRRLGLPTSLTAELMHYLRF